MTVTNNSKKKRKKKEKNNSKYLRTELNTKALKCITKVNEKRAECKQTK